jgi:hypothetical protein
LAGSSATDNQNCGTFQGFSDAYFYSNYGNQEGIYEHPKDKNGGGLYNREELQTKLTL